MDFLSVAKESKEEKNRKRKKNKDALGFSFFLLNVSRSMCFGKSGGRCKSLQCWMMSRTCVAMKRGVFVFVISGVVVLL